MNETNQENEMLNWQIKIFFKKTNKPASRSFKSNEKAKTKEEKSTWMEK